MIKTSQQIFDENISLFTTDEQKVDANNSKEDCLMSIGDCDNFITRARKFRIDKLFLQKENKKIRVPSKESLSFGAMLECFGFVGWDIKNHPNADIVVKKDGKEWFFEIKETNSNDRIFGAATLTEWNCAMQNKGRYYFVIVIKDSNNPQYFILPPDVFMAISTIPPFKVNFNTSRQKLISHKDIVLPEQLNGGNDSNPSKNANNSKQGKRGIKASKTILSNCIKFYYKDITCNTND